MEFCLKFKIALIEDDLMTQELMKEVVETDQTIELTIFNYPCEYVMKGEEFDLVVSDWNFGHITLEAYLESIRRDRLVILTGSIQHLEVDCLLIIHKSMDVIDLLKVLKRLIMQSRSFF